MHRRIDLRTQLQPRDTKLTGKQGISTHPSIDRESKHSSRYRERAGRVLTVSGRHRSPASSGTRWSGWRCWTAKRRAPRSGQIKSRRGSRDCVRGKKWVPSWWRRRRVGSSSGRGALARGGGGGWRVRVFNEEAGGEVADGALYNSCVGLGVCERARELISAVGWNYLFFSRVTWVGSSGVKWAMGLDPGEVAHGLHTVGLSVPKEPK
jgi:hypothetical protein